MARYQRYVYYIYNYEQGEKRGNVGFLRVEVRGESCKMTISVRTPSQTEPLTIYFFSHNRQQMPCYPAGIFPVRNGTLNTSLSYNSSNIADAGLSLSDISGMILFSSREKYYATTWDDEKILIDEMVIIEENNSSESENRIITTPETPSAPVEETPEATVPVNSSAPAEEISETISPESPSGFISESRNSEILENIPATMAESNTRIPLDIPQEQREPSREPSGELPGEDSAMEVQSLAENENPGFAKKLLSTYPKMYPFENDEILDCVRIELQDIHELPITYWSLAHNSFLMQGYYSYLHLVFALMQKPEGDTCYIIGIPGICHVKQNYLAGLFGFHRFIPLRQTTEINGEFGYWICEVSKTIA